MRIRRALAGLMLAGGLATTLGAAPATAAAGSVHLSIEATGQGGYRAYFVSITGFAPVAVAGQGVCVNLYGDDTFDHHLFGGFGVACGETLSNPAPGRISISFYLDGNTLNEDWGGDEVFAKVDIGPPSSVRLTSNVVHGNY